MHGRRQNTQSVDEPGIERKSRLLLVLLCLAQLMVILDISAVNVALPQLARDVGIARADLGWAITSYSVVFGSLLLLGGRAADLLGRRRVFLTGLGVFSASSLASALAGGAATLFAARAGQGLGAALLSPAALSILMTTFSSGRERATALSAWGAIGGAGAAIGVLLGGALTELVDWRAIFFINLPIGAGVAAGVLHVVAADADRPRPRGLDVRGAVVATASFAALVFAATQANSAGWASAQTLVVGLAGVCGLVAFAALELRTVEPLLRIQRLRDRAVGGGFAMMLAASAVLFGSFLLTSLYLQNVLRTGALDTGLAFLPLAVATGLGAHAGSTVISHAGVRVPLAGAFVVAAGGLLLLSGVDAQGSYLADVLPGMLITGLALGVILVSIATAVLTGARDEETGMLSGLNTTGHEIGGSIGVAVLVTIATGTTGASLADGIGDAFFAAALLSLAAGMVALAVLPPARTFLPKLRLAPPVAAIH
jgi:EmrB/QacA subfamily drug resistance transporter